MTQKERISDLNQFFSKVSYDFYNIPMAILLCFYNNKFQPLTYNEILKDILSRKDSKKKLRKSTGEEYSGLELAIKNLLNNRKKLFKKIIDEEDNEPKYSMILDRVQRLWDFNLQAMSKIKNETNKSQSKVSKHKTFLEYEGEDKNLDYELNNALLSKKTKRKNFLSDEESKESNLRGFSIYHPKGYKTNYKSNKNKRSRSRSRSRSNNQSSSNDDYKENDLLENEKDDNRGKSMDKVEKMNKNGYLSEGFGKSNFNDLNANNGRGYINNFNLKNILTKNNIYDKIPKIDENMLNDLQEKFNKLGQKIKEIQSDLKSLSLSKTMKKYFNENCKKSERQKAAINNYYDEINSLFGNKNYNIDNFKEKYDFLKKGMSTFLEIYENSYENLFRYIFEENNILELFNSKREENIQKDITDCFTSLNKFISVNKKQIHDSYFFLTNYTRNFYLKKFESVIAKIESKHKDNMLAIEEENNKIKQNMMMNKSIGKNSIKFFHVQKVNHGPNNKKDICAVNINNNIMMKNNVNNKIILSRIVDCTEYNRDAPPAGNINTNLDNNNNKMISSLEAILNTNINTKNIKTNVNEIYNDITSNDNNENNDSIDNGFMSDNSKEDKENNENEIYGENEKYEVDSNVMSPTTPSFYNNEFSVGSENNI